MLILKHYLAQILKKYPNTWTQAHNPFLGPIQLESHLDHPVHAAKYPDMNMTIPRKGGMGHVIPWNKSKCHDPFLLIDVL